MYSKIKLWKTFSIVFVIGTLVQYPSSSVLAQETHRNTSNLPDPKFISLAELLPAGGIRLSGGIVVNRDDWKSIAISRVSHLTCTANLVGPRIIFTSAHCLDKSPTAERATIGTGTISFEGKEISIKGCEVHPDYLAATSQYPWPRHYNDFALCELKHRSPLLKFETLGKHQINASDTITLAGFGCFNMRLIDGVLVWDENPKNEIEQKAKLRIGLQRIESIGNSLSEAPGLYARTVSSFSEVNVCPGDSGGPVLTGIENLKNVKKRQIVALSSAFHYNPEGGPPLHSYLAILSPEVRRWLEIESNENNWIVCGLQRQAGEAGCRQ